MADKYRISARVQPFTIPGSNGTIDDARLKEVLLMVPVRGDKTIGDLFQAIEDIYSQIYTRAGILRIRSLESELGEILHTSFLIEDCFQKRSETNDSTQWTVIVKRQAPTAAEVQEYRSRARQFSFDDRSYARPQGPPRTRIVVELSTNTPTRARLPQQRAIQADGFVEEIIPSTERDLEPPIGSPEQERRLLSPIQTIIPNSQMGAGVEAYENGNVLQPIANNARQEIEPESELCEFSFPHDNRLVLRTSSPETVSYGSRIGQSAQETPTKQSRHRNALEENDEQQIAPVTKRRRSTPAKKDQAATNTAEPVFQPRMPSTRRRDQFSFDDQTNQPPLGSSKKVRAIASSAEQLPEHPPSRTHSRSIPLDDRVGIRHPSRPVSQSGVIPEARNSLHDDHSKMPNGISKVAEATLENERSSMVSDHTVPTATAHHATSPKLGRHVVKRSSVPEQQEDPETAAREERTNNLRAEMVRHNAEVDHLSAGTMTTPRKKNKLTPPIPGSTTKKSPKRHKSTASQDAADQGLELLNVHTTISPAHEKRSLGRLSKDRFATIDAETRAEIQSLTSNDPAGSKQLQPVIEVTTDDSATDDHEEGSVNASHEATSEKTSNLKPSTKSTRRVSFTDEPARRESLSTITSPGPQPTSAATGDSKKKRGRPSREEKARRDAEEAAENERRAAQGLPPLEKKLTAAQKAAEKARKADQGSTPVGKKSKPVKRDIELDADGNPIKRKRGRPRKTDVDVGPGVPQEGSLEQIRGAKRADQKGSAITAPGDELMSDTIVPKKKSGKLENDAHAVTDNGGLLDKPKTIKKRKADHASGNSDSTKKRKTTKGGASNAHAMDESEDRAAVVSASQKDNKPNPVRINQHANESRSYSRSPAKEITSESETDSTDSGGEDQGHVKARGQQIPVTSRSVDNIETDDDHNNPKTLAKTMQPSSKQKGRSSMANMSSHVSTKKTTEAPPPSSAAQAEAQLQSEDTASNVSQRRPSFTAVNHAQKQQAKKTATKHTGLSALRREAADRQSQGLHSSQSEIRVNPDYARLMKQNPTQLERLSDDSEDAEDTSDDDDDDGQLLAQPNSSSRLSNSTLKGFRGVLVNRPSQTSF